MIVKEHTMNQFRRACTMSKRSIIIKHLMKLTYLDGG